MNKPCLWQCLLAMFITLGVLLALGLAIPLDLLGAIGAGALTSTTALMCLTPHATMARSRNILGGYIIGILVGVSGYALIIGLLGLYPWLTHATTMVIVSPFVVGGTLAIMLGLETAHVPAVGLAIGLVVEKWQYPSLVVIMFCVLVMVVIRFLLRHQLENLL